ncbi:unnamed protein product [marine sediment metagenome]|uniref:Uncharacterized protein n=1 Tax=marine sediment metagenome TaxID=412755 RepID=X0UTP7_9ZZZZ
MTAFLKPEYQPGVWFEIDGTNGLESFPYEYFTEAEARDSYMGEIWECETVEGIGARLSAPGFLDCTSWTVYPTMEHARTGVSMNYGVDPDTGESYG